MTELATAAGRSASGDVARLRGSTWGHSRGFTPMVATAQRFAELNPGVAIDWEQRSLQAFADFSIEQLAEAYDLLVIDHPWIAQAAERRTLVPLDDLLPSDLLDSHRRESVGPSWRSYAYGGTQWAVPIDAASPVASYRPDLLEAMGVSVPRAWPELLSLAERGVAVMPGIPLDMLGHFNMFCGALGELPFESADVVVTEAVGVAALVALRDLVSRMRREIFELNPIQVYEAMTTRDDFAYCVSGYGYTNYARPGYAPRELRFTTMARYAKGSRFQGTLGGAGLAISARSAHRREAAAYAAFVASPGCQRTLYVESGGQPAHRGAWLDDRANWLCGGFFRETLEDLDGAMLRPQYDGYMTYQDEACLPVWEYVRDGGDPSATLRAIDSIYRRSRRAAGGLV